MKRDEATTVNVETIRELRKAARAADEVVLFMSPSNCSDDTIAVVTTPTVLLKALRAFAGQPTGVDGAMINATLTTHKNGRKTLYVGA